MKAARLLLPLLAAALIALPVASASGSPRPGAVKLKIRTKGQDALLEAGKLAVRIAGPRGTKVRLSARQGEAKGLVRRRSVRIGRPGRRSAKLTLTAAGRRALGDCGPQLVTVEGRYRRATAAGSRKARARRSRRLAAGSLRCVLHVDAPDAERCDPIDPAHCLAPFPNDYFTASDGTSATGRRLALDALSMPANVIGQRISPTEYNRNDGFSPNSPILTKVPAVQTQAAFDANGFVAQTAIGEYARGDQPVVLIDAATGERHPVWAELDETPGLSDAKRLLIIRPAEALDYGRRYIVALRGLTTTSGAPVEPASPIFRAYRDKVQTDDVSVESRRAAMESIFASLGAAGIARPDLYLAWDFTVSSRDSLTGRLRAMRDDAFAQLGDTDLADGIEQGSAPAFTITGTTPYALCNSDADPACSASESDYALRKVTGTVEVPCYLDAQSESGGGVPCGPGSRMTFAPGTQTPVQNGATTFDAPFTCLVPRAAASDPTMGEDRPPLIFGHGLLGDDSAVEDLRLYPASLQTVVCGTAWIGMSSSDLFSFLPSVLSNLSRFPALVDRSQQGMLNFLYLARAMAASEAQGGMEGDPAFQGGGGADHALDSDREVGYFGASQGGIFGGAATAVAPDWQQAVLGVPAMGFATLITRSTQFNQFLPLVNSFYTDPLERQIGYSLIQALWDRGEAGGYVHAMTGDELPGTPEHKVVLIEAFGDHQVSNIQTEAQARTLGAVVRSPIVAPGRSGDSQPFWKIAREPSSSFTAPGGYGGPAVLYVLDTGAMRVEDWDGDGDDELVGTNANPVSNTPPVDGTGLLVEQWFDGLDPHEPVASSPAAQQLAAPFLLGLGVAEPDDCLATGGIPVPCTAPPIHVLGEGL